MDGTWESTDTWKGINGNMTDIAPVNSAVPSSVVLELADLKTKIANGEFHPFQGPIMNQAGELVIPAGETLDDGSLLGMDYYVSGVDGKLE
jgi:simple sugar transport system substrate-binding protein